jgi:hypothetical protein
VLAAHFDAKIARLEPDAAARIILRAVARNAPRALVGYDAKLFDILVRVLGARYQRLVADIMRPARER